MSVCVCVCVQAWHSFSDSKHCFSRNLSQSPILFLIQTLTSRNSIERRTCSHKRISIAYFVLFITFSSLLWLSAVLKAIKFFREFVWLMSLFLEAGGKRSVYSYKEKKKTRDFLQAHAGGDEGKTSKFTLLTSQTPRIWSFKRLSPWCLCSQRGGRGHSRKTGRGRFNFWSFPMTFVKPLSWKFTLLF